MKVFPSFFALASEFEREGRVSRFEGRSVVVTGAGSGIGKATAILLATEGARLVCADVSEEGLGETASAVSEVGAEVRCIRTDVREVEETRAMAAMAQEAFSGIDVLVNCAGIFVMEHTTELPPEAWRRVIDINLTGTFYSCQSVLPALLESRGNIVNLASTAGLDGQAYNVAYCASKGGVIQLTRALAVEYARRGVRVNCLCPGGVRTPMTDAFQVPAEADPDLVARLSLVEEMGHPDEIAAAIAYLASPDARYINGAVLPIDGGATAA